ncbi:MAG: cobalamin-binding protein [Victivallales bacterium]|nr:cobalamin-binding protein [Victivallales bacterium]
MKRILFIYLLLSVFWVFAAGGKSPRVVSLSPNLTETVFALGQERCLVGRSDACNYPAAAKKIPVAGNFGRPNTELVLALKPDYLISAAMQDKAMIERFEQFNIKVLFLPAASFADYFRTLKILGEILNCPDRAARLREQAMTELRKLEKAAAGIPEAQRPKVLFVIQDTPLYTVGKSSFINDMIRLAGGRNITAGEDKAYFKCSLEWVLRQQPDVIIMPAASETQVKTLAQRPGWKDLQAIKKGRIFYKFDPDLVSRMGPRTLQGIKILRQCLLDVK